jgi:hypothetical protein
MIKKIFHFITVLEGGKCDGPFVLVKKPIIIAESINCMFKIATRWRFG